MELIHVDVVRLQSPQARLNACSDICRREVLVRDRSSQSGVNSMRFQPQSRYHGLEDRLDAVDELLLPWKDIAEFAGDDHLLTMVFEGFTDQAFAFSLRVHIGGVEKVDPGITRSPQQ